MKNANERDENLGMSRPIARRDFIHASLLTSLGLMLPYSCINEPEASEFNSCAYPPLKTGMRGAHDGSYEVAHALVVMFIGLIILLSLLGMRRLAVGTQATLRPKVA